MRVRWSAVTVDCTDPQRLAAFWGALLGWRAVPSLPGWTRLTSDDDATPRLTFQPVPEPRRGKVRLHLDLVVDDVEAAGDEVERLGGRRTGERHEYDEGTVVVHADPEGNEFCLTQYVLEG